MKLSIKQSVFNVLAVVSIVACSVYTTRALLNYEASESFSAQKYQMEHTQAEFEAECTWNVESWGDYCHQRFCQLSDSDCPSDEVAGSNPVTIQNFDDRSL